MIIINKKWPVYEENLFLSYTLFYPNLNRLPKYMRRSNETLRLTNGQIIEGIPMPEELIPIVDEIRKLILDVQGDSI